MPPTPPRPIVIAAPCATDRVCAPARRAPEVTGFAATAEFITPAASMPPQCTNRHVNHGANTAIVNLISKTYDTATPAQLLITQQSRYRIAADGSLSIITIDNQFSTNSTDHYVYTKL